MDVIRVKLLQDLRKADRHQRLGVYYPYKHDLESMPINLHAKVMIVDDRFVRVGSSNINNRSMGLDTECDVAIESAPQDERIKQGVIGFRDRLLSEHLGIETSRFHDAVADKGSMFKAIESQRRDDKKRTLKPLEDKLPDYTDSVLTESDLVDPEQPVDLDKLIYHTLPEETSSGNPKRVVGWLAGLLVMLALAAVWRYTPVGESLDVETITRTLDTVGSYPFAPLWLFIGFVCAALFMIPVTMLIIASVIVFGPFSGAAYAVVSAVASATAGYGIGALLGRDAIQGLARGKINRISQRLAKRGVFTVVLLRIVPVAPFTIINLVAGASHIKIRDFFWGTVLGIIPGTAAVTLLADRVKATLSDPQPETIALLGAIAVLVVAASYLLSRYLMKYRED